MLNEVKLIGRLGADPELKHTTNGNAVCNLSVATTKKWTDKKGEKQEKTEWHRIVCWQRVAEIANEYGSKGDLVFINGELETRSWEDKEGQKRYTTEVVARVVLYLNTREKPTTREQSKEQADQGGMLDKDYNVNTDANFAADDIPF